IVKKVLVDTHTGLTRHSRYNADRLGQTIGMNEDRKTMRDCPIAVPFDLLAFVTVSDIGDPLVGSLGKTLITCLEKFFLLLRLIRVHYASPPLRRIRHSPRPTVDFPPSCSG